MYVCARVVSILAMLAFCAGTGRACAEATGRAVKGDLALLEMLSAAQVTGRSSFAQGSLKAKIHATNSEEVFDAETLVVWRDSSTYWDFKQTILHPGREPEITEGEMIQTRDLLICYWPARKMAQIIRDGLYGYRRELRVRPEQRWFGLLDGEQRGWADFFDVGTSQRPPKVIFDELEVNVVDDDEIVVSRLLNGSFLHIRASPKVGGNVVKYENTTTANDPMWYRGTYEWDQLSDKRWRLKDYRYVLALRGDKAHPDQTYELSVMDFDPKPEINAQRFSFESLAVPKETLIEEVSKGGTRSYRQGKKAPTRQEELDDLARGLRHKGFAAKPDIKEKP